MEYVLGIDIGTGSAKAVAVSLNSETIAVAQNYYTTSSPGPGLSEQDPEVVWKSFNKCLKDIVDTLQWNPLGICFSSAMHSLILVDKVGNKLTDMITWADCRSDDIATRLNASQQGIKIYESSGMPVHAMSPLCKIIWFRENMPDIFAQTYKFISIKEYIWFKLFGEYVVDHSIACASGMLDISSRVWNKELLALAGITADKLSTPVSTSYNRTDSNVLKGNEVRYVIGASDGCLANLGSFATTQGVAAVTIGTSGAVRVASNKPIFNRAAMTFSYCLDENTFICGGPVNNGGNVLQWLITNYLGKSADKNSFEEVFAQAEKVNAGSQGLLFLPYINGERAPIWDAKSSGAFIGIRSDHTQAHFCRAVLEGVCYALNAVLHAVESHSGSIHQINVSGGFVTSHFWMQLLSDITGKPLSLVQTEDASAMGAAFMAIKALGLNGGKYPEEKLNAQHIIILPDLDKHKMHIQNFVVFKSLYSSLKDTMHQLNPVNS